MKIITTHIISYDIVSSPSFGSATLAHSLKQILRKSKINKIFGIKKPLN